MKKIYLLLVAVVTVLAGCNQLPDNNAQLDPQRVDSCSYYGVVGRGSAGIYTQISASCQVIKDGYDTVTAYVTLERGPTQEGPWSTIAQGPSMTKSSSTSGTETYRFPDRYASASCDGTDWFRGKMRITWRNLSGTVKGSTYYYAPREVYTCP